MRWAVSLAIGALAALTSVAGCSPETRHRVLVLLFEDVPPPEGDGSVAPVVRSPRHPAPSTPTPTPAVAPATADANRGATFSTWDDVRRLLPKDPIGNPDWVAALDEKVIAPRPGLAPEASEADVLALDVELVAKSDRAFSVTFSHQKHGGWLTCRNCHNPDMFEMKAGTPMAPEAVHSGRFCAACHGKVAFDIVSGCPLCHLRSLPKDANGAVDWGQALAEKLIAPRAGRSANAEDQPTFDLDVQFKPQVQPTFKTVFSHASHTKWLACANCHPHPFPKQAGATDATGEELHSRRYCGACHGSVAFGITHACSRCHPAAEKTRQHQSVLDLDVEVPSKSQPTSKTIFSHKIHTQYLQCANCHTDVYEHPTGATRMTLADLSEGKYCAACHGKVAADLMAHCQRCHATLGGAK